MSTNTNQLAGEAALEKLQEMLEELTDAVATAVSFRDDTHAFGVACADVADLLGSLVSRYQGSYHYNGHDGIEKALLNPGDKKFDHKDW